MAKKPLKNILGSVTNDRVYGPYLPQVCDIRSPFGKDPSIGGRYMGVGPYNYAHTPVQIPT